MKITINPITVRPLIPKAKEIPFSSCFVPYDRPTEVLMRVKPVSWMLNSSLVQDKLTQGYIFVVDMRKGNFGCLRGDTEVQYVEAELIAKKF